MAAELGLDARMRLVDFAFAGVDPEVMGIGPVPATEALLARNDLTIDDIGLIEINEAFAVQVLAFLDHFKIADDDPGQGRPSLRGEPPADQVPRRDHRLRRRGHVVRGGRARPDPLGLPMSPFFLLQLVGPAVALHVAETLAAAYPDRFTVSPKLRALVAAGHTTVYRPDFTVDESVAAILAGGDRPSSSGEVRERALEALAEEIRLMLDEGVVAAPEDIDLCMILGAGWPFHLGGITPYLDRAGITEKVTGSRFRP